MTRLKGRPSKYNKKTVKLICEAIADGVPYKFAAHLGGISYETFNQWRRSFPEFSDAISLALAKGVHVRLRNIRRLAKEGNVKADQWWLEHVMPQYFGQNRDKIHNEEEETMTPAPTQLTNNYQPVTKGLISAEQVRVAALKFLGY